MLARTIHCFEQQTYPERCMLILDDGQQLDGQTGDDGRWRLISWPERFKSLGAKRNASIALAESYFGKFDAVCPVDDDDIVFPWHTQAAAAALEKADWSRPSQVLMARADRTPWQFVRHFTGHRLDERRNRLFHPGWAMRLETILAAGGYPEDKSGPEDKALVQAMEQRGAAQADPVQLGFCPSYCYTWHTSNISGRLRRDDPDGKKAWASLEQKLPRATLEPWDPPFSLAEPIILPGVQLRPF
jgi:hypothetical protein